MSHPRLDAAKPKRNAWHPTWNAALQAYPGFSCPTVSRSGLLIQIYYRLPSSSPDTSLILRFDVGPQDADVQAVALIVPCRPNCSAFSALFV